MTTNLHKTNKQKQAKQQQQKHTRKKLRFQTSFLWDIPQPICKPTAKEHINCTRYNQSFKTNSTTYRGACRPPVLNLEPIILSKHSRCWGAQYTTTKHTALEEGKGSSLERPQRLDLAHLDTFPECGPSRPWRRNSSSRLSQSPAFSQASVPVSTIISGI